MPVGTRWHSTQVLVLLYGPLRRPLPLLTELIDLASESVCEVPYLRDQVVFQGREFRLTTERTSASKDGILRQTLKYVLLNNVQYPPS